MSEQEQESALTVIEPLDEKQRALALAGGEEAAGTLAIALLPQEQFEARLQALVLGRQRIDQIHRDLMRKDVDYGVIPGTKTPSLLKPGAEKLADFYQLRAAFEHVRTVGTPPETPAVHYRSRCDLHLGSLDGPIVAQGYGSASTHEKKYRWRSGRACPTCGMGTILKSKFAKSGKKPGWYCYAKAGGCGAEFDADYAPVAQQDEGQVENTDPHDLDNTILKISEKRAFIDAVLRGTAASGLFTQDVGDTDAPPPRDDGGADDDSPPHPAGGASERSAPPPRSATTSQPPAGTSAPVNFEGKVVKPIDTVREKPRPDWYTAVPPEQTVSIAELAFKVGNSKHTAILVDDLAEAAHDAKIEEGELVRTDGQRVEVDWPNRGNLPMKKELHGVTRLEVKRADEWVTIGAARPSESAAATTGSAFSTPAEPPDLAQAAADAFGEMAKPARSIEELLALPAAAGKEGDVIQAELTLLVIEEKTIQRVDGPVTFARLTLTDGEHTYPALMSGDEAAEQLAGEGESWQYAPGQLVKIAGTWVKSGGGNLFVMLAAVAAA